MPTRRNISQADRAQLQIFADARVANDVRQAAHDRGIRLWALVEQALELGLPLLPPVGEALPDFAYDTVHRRGRTVSRLFVTVAPHVVAAVRTAATERHAHAWWVAQEALTLALPLLPAPTRVPALDDDEELRQSA